MKKSLVAVFLLGIAVLLVGCHHEEGSGGSEITETRQDDRAGEIFELGFEISSSNRSTMSTLKSENFDMYRDIALQNCKGLECGGNQPFERNEDLPVEIADYFSGQRYNMSIYTLLKRYENNDLILDQENAEFEFLTDTDFVSDGDQIIISDVKNQLPIVLAFKKIHYVAGNYERTNTIIVFSDFTISPRFYDIETISHNEEIQNYKIETLFHAIMNYGGKKDKLVKLGYNINEKMGTDFNLTLKGLDKASRVDAQITMSDPDVSYNSQRNGNNLTVNFDNLERGSSYQFDLKFIEKENQFEYIYDIKFNTIENFEVLAEKQLNNQNLDDNGDKLGNNYAICFTQPIDEDSLSTKLDDSIGSGNYYLNQQGFWNEFDDKLVINQNYCYKISFYTDPNEKQNIALNDITSEYGESLNHVINLEAFTISENDSYFKLIGNPITFLAKKGEYGHKIQFVNKNKTSGMLYYRACEFVGNDTDAILQNFAQAKQSDYYSNRFLAQNFVTCEETQSYEVNNIQKKYRKEYVQEIEFGELFSGGIPNIIEVGVEPFVDGKEKNNGYLYVRTNIGLLAKYTPNELHVWAHHFDNGKALGGAAYILGYYDEVEKEFITVKGGIKDYFNYSFPKDIQMGFLYVYDEYDASFILLPKDGFGVPQHLNKDYIYFSNLFSINAYDIGGSPAWGKLNEYKLYTYTDRVLYKAGEDEIFVSGWIRKQGDSKKPRGTLSIELHGPQGDIVDTQSVSSFDEFGGFKAKFALDKDVKLGSYRISSNFSQYGEETIYYSNYIQVQEYKKPNIALNSELYDDEDKLFLRITPQYYFGQYLKKYDVELSYSLQKQNYGIYDWSRCGEQRCDAPYYYNVLQNYQGNSGGNLSIDDYEGKYFDLDLSIDSSSLANFTIDVSLVDDETKEVVHSSLTEKILPKYLVGIKGRTRNWHNTNEGDFLLEGELLEKISNDKDQLKNYEASANQNIEILVYHKTFDNEQELGPDGEYYYTNRGEYTLEKTINSKTKDGKFTEEITFDRPGNCFVRVIYNGKNASYENQQYIYISDWDYSSYYSNYGDVMGYMGNNYELEIFVKDKEYEAGEDIEVNIDPYIKGATAIVTVEKNGKILEQKNLILDGRTITLKAQKDRYPNAHVSVVQIVGEELNKTISKRSEPRFYIGYENMKLSPQMMAVDFDVSISNLSGEEQEYYYPGQKISLDIQTQNHNNNGLKSRVSVGIVDKALLDIYDELREPLEDFYIFSNPGFFIISNYHLLFKALEVFNADGSKGGGGGEGGSSITAARKNFLDIAFWRGGEITDNNGNLHFETTLADNLTTRVVDLIAVGIHGEMGTHRQYFTVSKDVILSVFLPRFIASYNTVRVPVSIITNKSGLNIDTIGLQGTIMLGDLTQDIEFIKSNDEYYFDLNIDSFDLKTLLENEYIEIDVAAGNYDAVNYKLPIRKENMTINIYKQYDKLEVSDSVSLDSNAKYAQVDLVVSTVPIAQVSEAIRYLLRYPYGCTEQLLSSMYPTLIAKDLYNKGFLEEGIISGSLVNYQGNRNDIDMVITSTLNKIYKNQTSEGLFSYRQGGETPNKSLSIYVFHILSYVQDLGYEIDQDIYNNLSRALKDFDNAAQELYAMMQLALVGKNTSTQHAAEILKKDSSLGNKIMTYVIYAYNDFDDQDLYKEIKSGLDKQGESYNYSAYYDLTILKSYLTRALIKNGKNTEAFVYIKEFIKDADTRGMRGWSTQRNMQIIRAIADYMFEEMSQENDISGDVSINGESFPFKLGFLSTDYNQEDSNSNGVSKFLNHQKFSVNLEDISQVDISVDSNKEILTSLKINYIPENIRDIESKKSNVKSLNMGEFKIKDLTMAKIGDIVPVVANFAIEKDVRQLAVVYNIPAFSFLINNIGKGGSAYSCRDCYYYYGGSESSESANEISFTSRTNTNKRYSCTPDHYEIRYDRLFLYYDDLPANAECEITFSLIKTHAGTIDLLSQELFEMYSPDVWAREYLY